MLRGDRSQLAGELAAADGLDLVGVDLGTQTVLEARLEHLTGLLHRKGVSLAEHVAELRDALLLNERHHLLAHKADVLGAVGFVLGGHKVRAHEGRDHVHRVPLVEVADHTQRLELMLGGKTVAALGLAGGRAEGHHLIESLRCLCGQFLLGGSARGVGGGLDAAAGILDLEIGLTVELHAQLVLPPAAENKVRMGIHEARRDELSLGVDDLRPRGCGSLAGADGGDHAVLDEHPCVLEKLDFTLLCAAMGARALGRGEQADVFHQ